MLEKKKSNYMENMSNQSISMIDKLINYTKSNPSKIYPASTLEGTFRAYLIDFEKDIYKIVIDLDTEFGIYKQVKLHNIDSYFTVLYIPSIKALTKKAIINKFIDLAETLDNNTFVRNKLDIDYLNGLLK